MSFAPQLIIPSGTTDISFYINGLGATELMRWSNDDGTIHVAELQLGKDLFHLHEMNEEKKQMAPGKNGTVSAIIGLFTENVDGLVEKAVKAGATMLQPPITFEYNYRQAVIKDPFGHQWLIQKRV